MLTFVLDIWLHCLFYDKIILTHVQNTENRMIFELSGNFCAAMCTDFVAELDIFVIKRYKKQNFAVKIPLSAQEKKYSTNGTCA